MELTGQKEINQPQGKKDPEPKTEGACTSVELSWASALPGYRGADSAQVHNLQIVLQGGRKMCLRQCEDHSPTLY